MKKKILTILVNIEDKRNQNNQNAKWIVVENRDDGNNIDIITRGGANIG
jgi:hypothetical protein